MSVISNRNLSKTETSDSIPLQKTTEFLLPTNCPLKPRIKTQLQAQIKTIPSNPDSQNDPNESGISASKDDNFGAINFQFQFQNTASIPIAQLDRVREDLRCIIFSLMYLLNSKKFNYNKSIN